jgi:V8-like Glu-specific endopeptidase
MKSLFPIFQQFSSRVRNLFRGERAPTTPSRRPGRKPNRVRPGVEALEERVVLSLSPVTATANDPFSGIVSIKATWNDLPVKTWDGSGAFIDATHILTAAHVVYKPESLDNGHFADSIDVLAGNGRHYRGWLMTVDSLFGNGVFADNDIAVITLDPNGGSPPHYNFGVTNNADQLDYSTLQLWSIGYPGDNTYFPSLQQGTMYQTTGYATGIDTTTDWINHTRLVYWQNHPWDDRSGLSLYSGGQSGSPLFGQDASGHYDIVGVLVGGQSDANKHGLPNGEGWATALTSQMFNFVQEAVNGSSSNVSHHVANVPTQSATSTAVGTFDGAPVQAGQQIQFSATVTGGTGTPGGTVSFYDGNTYLGASSLPGGNGSNSATTYLIASLPTPGTHTITAVYSGDASHLGSSGTGLQQIASAPGTPPPGPPSGPPAALPAVANALTHSAESFAAFVTAAYQRYLGRTPDAPGLATWVAALQAGLTDEHLEAAFIGSPEYIADHGGPGEGWVRGMYRNLLGRDADSQGVAFWLGALAHGTTPAAIAYGFAASAEREAQRITADYQRYLGRAPESAVVVDGWVRAFLAGANNEDVIAGFVGSAEYFRDPAKGAGSVDSWVRSAYEDVLNRGPAPAEVAAWEQVLGRA